MPRLTSCLLLLVALAGPCAPVRSAEVATSTRAAAGIPHFRQVRPGVYRGGQPTAEGWAYLRSLGIKTVVKLDLPSEGSDAEAEKLGMTVIDASGPPAAFRNFLGAPKPERLRLALQALEDEKRWPVYVHCRHGQDRTGLVIGLFRVLHDHYTKLEAYREMRDNGFHRSLVGLLNVWKRFDGKTPPGQVAQTSAPSRL